jgi:hypothetical protein
MMENELVVEGRRSLPLFTPPPGLYLPRGITRVEETDEVVASSKVDLTASQKLGLAYEKKAIAYLANMRLPMKVAPGFAFYDDTGKHYCVPDVIINLDNKVVIIECKISHSYRAWCQLRLLYQPVLRHYLQRKPVSICEMTRNYEAQVGLPEPVNLILDERVFIEFLMAEPHDDFMVYRWKPEKKLAPL